MSQAEAKKWKSDRRVK